MAADTEYLRQQCTILGVRTPGRRAKLLISLVLGEKIKKGELEKPQGLGQPREKRFVMWGEEEPTVDEWNELSAIGIKLELKKLERDEEGRREELLDILKENHQSPPLLDPGDQTGQSNKHWTKESGGQTATTSSGLN